MEPQATPVPPTPPIPTPTMPDPYDQSAPTSPTVNTPVLSTPEPIQPPDSKMSQKLLVPAIILLVVAVVLVTIKLIFKNKVTTPPEPSPTATIQTTPSPTPDPTANWKTYTDKEFEYSLKYPTGPEYVQEACGSDFMNTFMLENIEGEDGSTHPTKLCVPRDYYASFELQPAKGVFAKNEYPTTIPGREVISEPIIIDGVEGRKYTIIRTKDAPIPEKTYEVYVEHNGYRYHFVFIDFKHEYLFDQILSTFKFLE